MFDEKPETQQQAELQAEREIARLREEVAHLRQGIAAYHADYRASCSLLGDCKSPEVEAWRERDRCRAEGRQLPLVQVTGEAEVPGLGVLPILTINDGGKP